MSAVYPTKHYCQLLQKVRATTQHTPNNHGEDTAVENRGFRVGFFFSLEKNSLARAKV